MNLVTYKKILLERLRCPYSGSALILENVHDSTDDIIEGWLSSADKHYSYPIRNGIPRFVPDLTMLMQWNHFAKTQLDSHSWHPISAERFWKATNWNSDDMKNVWVLDIGFDSGRFAEIALSTEAQEL